MSVNTSVKSRFTTIIAILVIGFLVFGSAALQTLGELKVNGPLYQRIIQGKDLIADVLPPPEHIIESYLVTLRLARSADDAEKKRLLERFTQLEREYNNRHAYWLKQKLDDEIKSVFLDQSYNAAKRFYEIAEKSFLPAVRTGDAATAQAAISELTAAYEDHRRALDDVVAMTTKRVAADEQLATSSIRIRTWILVLVFLASFAVAVVYSGSASRSIQHDLGGEPAVARALAESISKGDLSRSISVDTRAGDSSSLMHAMKSMHETLRTLIKDAMAQSERVSVMAQKLSKVTDQARRGMHTQQSEMERVTTAATETSSTSQEVARNCADAATAAAESSKKTDMGVMTMTRVRQSIDTLAADVDQAAQVIQGLKDESTKIGSVVDVINGIAEQTNLLALNAAIEAARAGEQGRGFAVVADEVRTLASRTQQSTKEIQQMVQSLQSGTANAVGVIERERSNAQLTVQNVVAAETLLTEISDAVKQFTGLTDQIASAARQQSDVSEEINRNIVGVHRIAQESLAGADQIAEVSQDLADLARELQSTVGRFKIA